MSRHSPGTALLKRPSWDSGSQWLISLTTPSRLCWMESSTASSGTKAGRTSLSDQLVPIGRAVDDRLRGVDKMGRGDRRSERMGGAIADIMNGKRIATTTATGQDERREPFAQPNETRPET